MNGGVLQKDDRNIFVILFSISTTFKNGRAIFFFLLYFVTGVQINPRSCERGVPRLEHITLALFVFHTYLLYVQTKACFVNHHRTSCEHISMLLTIAAAIDNVVLTITMILFLPLHS